MLAYEVLSVARDNKSALSLFTDGDAMQMGAHARMECAQARVRYPSSA